MSNPKPFNFIDKKIIVSLTTTSSRLDMLYYSIQSFYRQTMLPNMILVNISRDAYLKDDGIVQVPDWLRSSSLVRVHYVKNTGSYRKLLPTLDFAANDDLIVTADDDVIYGKDWLRSLVEEHINNPDKIICGSARQIKRNIFGQFQNYANWEKRTAKKTGSFLLPIGCAGILYTKKLINISFLTDECFLKLAATSDDIWFRLSSMLKGIDVLVNPSIERDNIYFLHKQGLHKINRQRYGGKNILLKMILKLWSILNDYLGISRSNNDRAWKRAYVYACEKYQLQ